MPQQNNSGPFSQYLTEAYKPQSPQATGFESPGIAAALIGSKFLDGLRQGRLHRMAMQEYEDQKNQEVFTRAMESLRNSPDIDPEVANQHVRDLEANWASHIAAQPISSKDTGNHLTDMLKNFAINMAGGKAPKKGASLDMTLVARAYDALKDPQNTRATRSIALNNQFAEKMKAAGVNDIRTAMQHPEYSALHQKGVALNGPDFQFDFLKSLAPGPIEAQQEKFKLGMFGTLTDPDQGPVTQSPPVTQAQPGATQSTAPNIATQAPPVANRNLFMDLDMGTANEEKMNYLGLPSFNKVPKRGTPRPVVGSDGVRRTGVFLDRAWNGYQPGWYDPSGAGDKPIEGAQIASTFNPDSPNRQLPPEEMAKIGGEIKKSLSAISEPDIARMTSASIDAQLASGDVKGAGDALNRGIQLQEARAMRKATMAVAASNAGASRDLRANSQLMQLSQQFNSSDLVKKMETADAYATNAQAAYNATLNPKADPGIYDLELLRTWAKLTDIMTGVREGEYRDLASAMGRLRSAGLAVDNILDATGKRMDPRMRNEVMASINRIRDTQYAQYGKLRGQFEQAAQESGLGSSPLLGDRFAKPSGGSSTNHTPGGSRGVRPDAPGRRRSGSALSNPQPTRQRVELPH